MLATKEEELAWLHWDKAVFSNTWKVTGICVLSVFETLSHSHAMLERYQHLWENVAARATAQDTESQWLSSLTK